MPKPGGPADKVGNRYEKKWAVAALLELLDGAITSITVEQVNVPWAEYKTTHGQQTTWHQVKLQAQQPANGWTIRGLGNVLRSLKKGLEQGDRCEITSSSSCVSLTELQRRATQSPDLEQYKNSFVEKDHHKTNFEVLQQVWKVGEETAFKWLKHLTLSMMDERSLHIRNIAKAKNLGCDNPEVLLTVLGDVYDNAIHLTYTREDLQRVLAGYRLSVPATITGLPTGSTGALPQVRRGSLEVIESIKHRLQTVDKMRTIKPQDGEEESDWLAAAEKMPANPNPLKSVTNARVELQALVESIQTGGGIRSQETAIASVHAAVQKVEDVIMLRLGRLAELRDDSRFKEDELRCALTRQGRLKDREVDDAVARSRFAENTFRLNRETDLLIFCREELGDIAEKDIEILRQRVLDEASC